jgi:hypothetical protein
VLVQVRLAEAAVEVDGAELFRHSVRDILEKAERGEASPPGARSLPAQ